VAGLTGGPGKPVLRAPTEAVSHSGRALDDTRTRM